MSARQRQCWHGAKQDCGAIRKHPHERKVAKSGARLGSQPRRLHGNGREKIIANILPRHRGTKSVTPACTKSVRSALDTERTRTGFPKPASSAESVGN